MIKETKVTHLQIRVSPSQKKAIERLADKAKMGMSQWILNRILPSKRGEWEILVKQLKHSDRPSYVLAEIHDLFKESVPEEFQNIVEFPPPVRLTPYWENYLAAMIEYAAPQKGISPPLWVREIRPLEKPVFGTELQSLRLHLLFAAPPCFRNRNIFIDSSIGDRV